VKVAAESGWKGFTYSTDTGKVFVSFPRSAGDVAREEFPFCARVIIPIKSPNHNGGPQGAESQTLWDMEDALTDALEKQSIECLMVGRLTHDGRREIVFQLKDWRLFRPPVGRWMGQYKDYAIDVSEHDGWAFFDESIWPSKIDWQLIMDQDVIDQLIKSGSDPKKEHLIEFVFVGERTGLNEIQKTLENRGYSTVSLEGETLVISRRIILEIGEIFAESRQHLSDASSLGVKYDGWGCHVVS
jgi:regulator of RNase E activity RraB